MEKIITFMIINNGNYNNGYKRDAMILIKLIVILMTVIITIPVKERVIERRGGERERDRGEGEKERETERERGVTEIEKKR